MSDRSAVYTMRAVCRRTGLSAHVIRIWERRYRAVQPSRTDGNMRRFSEEDIRRLSMLRTLSGRGHGIGQIARLPTRDLERLIAMSGQAEPLGPKSAETVDPPDDSSPTSAPPTPDHHVAIASYLECIRRFDGKRALEVLWRSGRLGDRRVFLYEVLLPILREVGVAWESGRLGVAHEHLASAQLESVLHALRGMNSVDGPRIMITTPVGHRHTLGALVAAFLSSIHGFEPVYIGGDLPDVDLLDAVELAKPEMLLLCVLREPTPEEARALEVTLSALSTRVDTWVAHPPGHSVSKTRATVKSFDDFIGFEAALESWRSKAT
ncbi:MAG: MerR family transcriptional regulator [Deltaproteobacteria bacterium]|nr:MerR family transcriptional regulator [Deltaproteobacteria bacterium]